MAIDTEFHREGTYFPKVALIQIAWAENNVALLDPLSCDLTPLSQLFDSATKFEMHAAAQDLEVFLRVCGTVPKRLFDTHIAVALSHCLFNIPLAVWILEGFMSAVPKELDETAYVDGYSFGRFFFKIFVPTIAAGIGITMFFCFMFSWVELLLAKTLTATEAKPIAATMTRTASTSGYELGLLAAAGTLTIIPGAIVIYFVKDYIAKGFAMGRV